MNDPPPTLYRLLPASLRRALRGAVRPYLDPLFGEYLSRSPHVDGRHLPIDPLRDKYVVPKSPRSDPSSPDGLPVPPRELWWDYTPDAARYLEIGRLNVAKMREILGTHGGDLRRGDRVLDFGCGAGPQTRCLVGHARDGEVWGVDISAPHVNWCIHHLPAELRFATTTEAPHLPFEDRYFDLVFCGSVFSHIGEIAAAWVLELARVIRPGGRLYLTINTKQSMYAYLERWPDLEFSRSACAHLSEGEIKSDFSVAVFGRGPWRHVVYDVATFQQMAAPVFETVGVVRNAYTYQTALVLVRRDTARGADETSGAGASRASSAAG